MGQIPISWHTEQKNGYTYVYTAQQKAFLAYAETEAEAVRLAKIRTGLLEVAA